jgi:NAD(P)-dependent dehydrogenase (short-subunit alcohol dehydrogenase family)
VSPGPILVEGRKWDSLRERRRAIFERDRDAHPMKRMGTAQEVANMVAVLASPAASWVNSQRYCLFDAKLGEFPTHIGSIRAAI